MARWKWYKREGLRKGPKASMLFLETPLSPNLLVSTNLYPLQTPSFSVFMKALLRGHD